MQHSQLRRRKHRSRLLGTAWRVCCPLILLLVPYCWKPEAQAATTLLSWSDWYPVDRGQAPGQRALNYWSHGVFDQDSPYNMHGQSTLNYPGTPATLPETFNGHTVDYFLNWVCTQPQPRPPSPATSADCRIDQHTYVEIMSQGSAYDSPTFLEHWALGFSDQWRLYYDPTTFSQCTAEAISGDLASPTNKVPLIMGLPAVTGQEYVGNLVCAVTYDQHEPDPAHIISIYTGLGFVVTTNLGLLRDAQGGEVIHARNEYYSNNPWWMTVSNDGCARDNDPRMCRDGAGKVRTQSNVTGYIVDVEDYWMRKVRPGDRLTNGFSAYEVDTGDLNTIIWDEVEPNTNFQRWALTSYSARLYLPIVVNDRLGNQRR